MNRRKFWFWGQIPLHIHRQPIVGAGLFGNDVSEHAFQR